MMSQIFKSQLQLLQMLKVSRNISSLALRMQSKGYFSDAKNEQKSNLVPAIFDNQKNFFKNIYGVQLEKHILPYNRVNFNWNADDIKEHRKKMSNYVVVLINKVIDNAEQIKQTLAKESEEDKVKELNQKFYNIGTYCRVRYYKKYTELEGLYRVKIDKIEEIRDVNAEKDEAQTIKNSEDMEQSEPNDEQDTVQLNVQQNKVIPVESITNALISKRPRKIKLNYYSLQVSKYEDQPLQLNHINQIKFKYLIETYTSLFPNHEYKQKFSLFNPNEILINTYLIAQHLSNENSKIKEIQTILEEKDFDQRMIFIQHILQKTLDWKYVYKQLQKVVESNIRSKKFYQWYSQVLKVAKQNLDGKKGKQLFLERVTKQFLEKKPPKEIKEVFDQQKQKYTQMEESATQASVVKKYLQDLSKIPYSIKSQELFDLEFAQKALDQEHYGMKDVKDTILEIIAVGKLKGSLKGKILCLIGGPGLGKTTIAKSIAKSLGRKFYNISLGGVTDSSVLKGHRRTYVAAYAGKIIQALKHCQTNNPVILLDEIDKMGSSFQGDPRSQLLQILDPNQNHSFVDNYIDLPVDLSNVLFICSANYERNISKPLLDRVEKIKISSYTDEQKKYIFNYHLLRRAIEKTGVTQDHFVLESNVIDALIYQYSLGQPGVRRLEKNIQKILERAAFKIVTKLEELPIKISRENLKDYLGVSYFNHRNHDEIGVGMAISLGGGDYGSRLTYIESFKKSFANKGQHKRGVMFTGSLGDVFKEAMNICYTFARNFLLSQLSNRYLFENEIHIHAPDGASKKDGSTDSLTICSSLVSLAIQKQARKGIAMTGQITLHGKILRTTGIKEKILLAKRQKIWNVIIPLQNKPDVQMLSETIKQGISFYFVSDFQQVYSLLFVDKQSDHNSLRNMVETSSHKLSVVA